MDVAKPAPATGAPQTALGLPELPPALVALGAVCVAALAGVLIAADSPLGVAFVVALFYVPIVLTNLQVGIALWIPTTFLTALGGFDLVCQAGALVIAFAWLGRLRGRVRPLPSAVAVQLVALGAFVLWIVLSVAWAEDPSPALTALNPWIASAVLFVVVVTSELDERGLRAVLTAYVVGVLLSMALGLLIGSHSSIESSASTYQQGRFQGAAGDPNYLAAAVVPAIALAGGLAASARAGLSQFAMAASIPLLVIGLVATESRGGILAALVAIVVAVTISRRGRLLLLAGITAAVGVAAIWFASSPEAWERITNTADKGNGRGSLWKVAWQMSGDHAPVGAGLGNFPVLSPEYARSSGSLEYVTFIAERSHVVHNVYLQMLAETGVIGVGLLLAVAIMSFVACARSIRRFEAAGAPALATLARAAAVALAAGLTASFFISNGSDWQLWMLLAFGPAMLAGVPALTASASRPASQAAP